MAGENGNTGGAGAAITGDDPGQQTGHEGGAGGQQGQAGAGPFDGLPEDMMGFVQAKGWTDVSSVIDSYRNLESFRGVPEDQLMRLPSPDASQDEWARVFDRLGRPESPEEYEVPVPEDGDEKFAEAAKKMFHEAGLTPAQAKTVAEKYNEYFQGMAGESHEQIEAERQQEVEALKKQWGAAYEQNLAVVDRAAQQFGMHGEQLEALRQAMGPKAAAEFVYNIGAKLGEDQYVDSGSHGNGDFGAMTPAAAREQIQALKADPEFRKRYMAGDPAAQAKMDRLHGFAHGQG